MVEQLAATYHPFTAKQITTSLVWQRQKGFRPVISSSVWSDSCVALKHFCDLLSRRRPMFALEAVSLTGLGDSELRCYSFFVPETVRFRSVSLCEGGELTPSKRQTYFCVFLHIILYVYSSFILNCWNAAACSTLLFVCFSSFSIAVSCYKAFQLEQRLQMGPNLHNLLQRDLFLFFFYIHFQQ